MVTMYDIDQSKLIIEAAKLLKEKNIGVPTFVPFVKTGVHKERPPVDKEWWYVRCASILRTVAVKGPIGTSKLRTKYGGKKNCGVKPEHHFKGSGSIIRHALQALETLGLVETKKDSVHKGRIVTTLGKKLLSEAAKQVIMTAPKNNVQAEVEENGEK